MCVPPLQGPPLTPAGGTRWDPIAAQGRDGGNALHSHGNTGGPFKGLDKQIDGQTESRCTEGTMLTSLPLWTSSVDAGLIALAKR